MVLKDYFWMLLAENGNKSYFVTNQLSERFSESLLMTRHLIFLNYSEWINFSEVIQKDSRYGDES